MTKSDHHPNSPIAEIVDRIDSLDGLRLRQWADPKSAAGIRDVKMLTSAWNDPAITRWNQPPPDRSSRFAASWIQGTRTQHSRSRSVDLVVAGDEGPVGEVGLQIDTQRTMAEIGFWIDASHRRRGYGRALLGLAERLVLALGINRTFAVTDRANKSTVSLLQRSGWVEVGTTTDDKRAFVFERPSEATPGQIG